MFGRKKLSNWFAEDLAIDLGTANTLVFLREAGIVIREPSVVAVKRDQRGALKVLAVGREAKEMVGKTPDTIMAIRPLKDGVISDFDVAEQMLRHFIQHVQQRQGFLRFKPRIVIAVPSGITQVEKRAVRESALSAGAREVFLIEEPMAAAIGAGLPIAEPSGNFVVDIGGGTTEVAVLSMAGIVYSSSLRMAGDKMDEAIVQYLKQKYNLLIGERTAEELKLNIGSAAPRIQPLQLEIKGRDQVGGNPKVLLVNDEEIRFCLKEVYDNIVHAIRVALEQTPPELAADIIEKGIVLAGGGSLLHGMDVLLRERTGLPVFYAEDPLDAVVKGTGAMLDQMELLASIALD
ncbi:MAG: rod shape-determining protein [bacterium]|jgi:rod shape-determining protein MreB